MNYYFWDILEVQNNFKLRIYIYTQRSVTNRRRHLKNCRTKVFYKEVSKIFLFPIKDARSICGHEDLNKKRKLQQHENGNRNTSQQYNWNYKVEISVQHYHKSSTKGHHHGCDGDKKSRETDDHLSRQ